MKALRYVLAAACLTTVSQAPLADHSVPMGNRFTVDVALDGRTWRLDDNSNPFWPTLTGAIARGDTFIVSGNIYPAGTLEEGGNFNEPNNPPGPPCPIRSARGCAAAHSTSISATSRTAPPRTSRARSSSTSTTAAC